MSRNRNLDRLARKFMEEQERLGHLVWTGKWKGGQKVYQPTPAGIAHAQQVLAEEGLDEEGNPL